jgi:hypothetical protein
MVSGSTLVPCGDDGGAPYIPPQDIPNPNDSYYGNYTGNNTTTTLTSPIDLCDTCPEFTEDPCVKLKNLFNTPKPDIKSTIINYMRPNIAVNPSGEIGVGLKKTDSRELDTRLLQPTTSNEIFIPTGASYYSGIHTHPLNTYPMFSWSDVYTLYKMNNNLSPINYGNASFLLVCQDDSGVFQTYAIVFDPNSFNENIDQFLNTPSNNGCTQEDIKDGLDQIIGEEFAKDSNYERVFLKFMAHTNVSLYKANSSLTNWSKLSMSNGFNNFVSSTPCN